MNRKKQAKFEAWTKITKALAHPARLAAVDELAHQERCVCELADIIGLDMSTMSRHLTQLKNVGILESSRSGTTITYRLRVKCILNFFSCVDAVLQANAKAQIDLIS